MLDLNLACIVGQANQGGAEAFSALLEKFRDRSGAVLRLGIEGARALHQDAAGHQALAVAPRINH